MSMAQPTANTGRLTIHVRSAHSRRAWHKPVAPTHCHSHPTARGHTQCHALGCWEGRMPLVGFEAVSGLVGTAARLHTFVVVGDPRDPNQQCLVADFMPLNPTSPATAVMLLTAGRAPGDLRTRTLPRFIKGQHIETRYIGPIPTPDHGMNGCGALKLDDVLREVKKFNSSWDSQLSLVDNNCNHHTRALIRHLTSGIAKQP